ncbi:MAG: response regulator [Desulfuromonadales bacterium]|nr:response regulator [Desulfuromonadales bacterium]
MMAAIAPKVLLVDDMDFFLEKGKEYLNETRVEVVTAKNGQQALDVALREKPDLIFLDVMMPVMDGLTCCRILKADPRLREIPVVMLFAGSKEVTADTCRRVGCDGVLTKPVPRETFLSIGHTFLPQIDRRETRLPCQAEINVRRAGGAETMATSADLSASGMYVVSQEPAAVSEIVRLYARFPRSIGAADISAIVVWVNQGESRKIPSLPSGFGVKFTGLNVATRLIITQVLTKLSVPSGSQRAIQTAV